MTDTVNTGTTANDGTGDNLQTAFQLINRRLNELLGTLSQITWAPGLAIESTPDRQWTVVSGQAYVATTNHTAGATFAADLAAGRWLAVDVAQLLADLASPESGKGASLVVTTGGRTAQQHFDDFPNAADKTSIQTAVDAVTGGDVARGALWFTPGSNHTLAAEVLVHRKTLRVQGQNAAIKWEGPNTESMFRVTDSARVVMSDLILLGDLDTPPMAALYFDQPVLVGTKGTNENHVIENVTIGRKYTADTTTGGSADATPYGRVQYGIRIGGAVDGNNDEYTIRNTQVHGATVAAISFDNAQHIWSMLEHVLVNDSAIGLRCGCNLTARNLHANRNTTADIEGIRNIEVNVDTFNSENAKLPIWSKAGASFYIWSGKVLINQSTPGNFARVENGGSLLLDGLTMVSVGAGAQTIYYRGSSGKGGKLTVRNCSITNGDARDTWDVETGGAGALPVEVDISHGPFVWRQGARSPYIDRAVTPAAVSAGASGIIGSGAAKTPFGTFINVSYSLPLQGQHLTPAYESAGQIRARLLNPTAGSITLAAGRMRWMAFEEHVVSKASANVNAPSMANGTGHTATVALPGAELGDFVVYAAGASYLNSVVTCYVSAPGTVALRIHNASGGISDPPDTLMYVGKVREFGNFIGTVAYTPAAIASGTTISVTVSVPGAQVGGHVFATYSADLQGLTHSAEVSAADTVTITASNYTGASVTLAAGYFRAMVAF